MQIIPIDISGICLIANLNMNQEVNIHLSCYMILLDAVLYGFSGFNRTDVFIFHVDRVDALLGRQRERNCQAEKEGKVFHVYGFFL